MPFITHLAFYAGWPTAATAIGIARRVFEDEATDAMREMCRSVESRSEAQRKLKSLELALNPDCDLLLRLV